MTETSPFLRDFNYGNNSQITLIGTIHLDTESAPPLFSLLKELRPECIAVEISRFSIEFRKRHQDTWEEKLESILKMLPNAKARHYRIELLKRQLKMPFEWETSRFFSKRYNVPIFPIDSCDISKTELPLWEKELITLENIDFLTSLNDMEIDFYFQGHRQRAIKVLTGGLLPNELVFDKNWCKRERHLAKGLLELSLRFGRVAYVGGWMHLIQEKGAITLAKYVRSKTINRFLIAGDKTIEIKGVDSPCLT